MIRAIVTDIEGTTSAIRFVKDVLFPYARERLPAFVREHGSEPEVRRLLKETAHEAGIDAANDDRIVEVLIEWIDGDRKATPLKALQGMIWKHGYEQGAYRAHLYPEVASRLQAWKNQGFELHVYSSGSVPAQKLFFGHSEAGDLTPLFSGYFDTRTGGKRESGSYRRIADTIGADPGEILFLSDVREELDAAADAGLRTIQVCRPPQNCPGESLHACVTSFDAIDPQRLSD